MFVIRVKKGTSIKGDEQVNTTIQALGALERKKKGYIYIGMHNERMQRISHRGLTSIKEMWYFSLSPGSIWLLMGNVISSDNIHANTFFFSLSHSYNIETWQLYI